MQSKSDLADRNYWVQRRRKTTFNPSAERAVIDVQPLVDFAPSNREAAKGFAFGGAYTKARRS